MIWSHRWAANQDGFGVDGPSCSGCHKLGGVEIGDTGYWIRDYTTEPENGGLGVFAHEFGHDLGLPDFYDTDPGRTDDNGAGFWTLMSSGSWLSQEGAAAGTTPNHMGPAEKLFLGWYGANDLAVVDGLADEPVEVTLGPSTRATTKGKQVVAVDLPDGHTPADGPAVGSTDDDYLYSGDRTGYAATATTPAPITIPPGDSTLSARVAYDIESGYDYAYLQVFSAGAWQTVETSLSTDTNPKGQNLGHGITGDSGGHGATWQPLTADLSAYAGEQVQLRWKYVTDSGTTYTGLMVDDLEVGDYSTAFEPGLSAGSSAASTSWRTAATRRRTPATTWPRTVSTATTTPPWSRGPTAPTTPTSTRWTTSPTRTACWSGTPTGATPTTTPAPTPAAAWLCPSTRTRRTSSGSPSRVPAILARSRLQSFDSTFDVDQTDALEMTPGDETLSVPAHPSVPVFEDADPEAYLDASGGPGGLWYSTGVSGVGSEIQVLSSDETTAVMKLKIGKRFVAATGEPEISGAPTVGNTLTATRPRWFQDDVTTEVAWLRDGEPVDGGAGLTYQITPADVDHTISASFTGSKPDYTDTTVETAGIEAATGDAPTPAGAVDHHRQSDARPDPARRSAPRWPRARDIDLRVDAWPRATLHGRVVPGPGRVRPSTLTLTETFESPGYDPATTTATVVIGKIPAQPPSMPLGITGTARVGQTLSAVGGEWTYPGDASYAWTVDGATVGTGTSYVVKAADLGKVVRLTKSLANPTHATSTSTAQTAPVTAVAPAPDHRPEDHRHRPRSGRPSRSSRRPGR